MCTTPHEAVPETWEDERDGSFFRITAGVLSADFVYGAGVLLAAGDTPDEEAYVTSADLVAVRLRRGSGS